MSDDTLLRRQQITVDMVHGALNLVTFHRPDLIEDPEPVCAWSKLCGSKGCRFPRYFRDGAATGLAATVLVELGYPVDVLKDLDTEYEIGEVLHPGVKIARSRNIALTRIDRRGVALLAFLQEHQKVGWSWSAIAERAFRPRWTIARLDARRRPWLY